MPISKKLDEKIITDIFKRVIMKSLGDDPAYASDPMKMDALVRELLEKKLRSKLQIENTEVYVSAIKTELLRNRLKREGMSDGKIGELIKGAEGAEARFGGVGSSHK